MHTLSETSTLGELLDLAYDRFNKEKDFQSRNILPPILCDLESFNLLAGETKKMGTTVMGQGMSSISPFSKQLFSKKNFNNNNLQNSIEKYSAPNPKDLLDSVCGYLVKLDKLNVLISRNIQKIDMLFSFSSSFREQLSYGDKNKCKIF